MRVFKIFFSVFVRLAILPECGGNLVEVVLKVVEAVVEVMPKVVEVVLKVVELVVELVSKVLVCAEGSGGCS